MSVLANMRRRIKQLYLNEKNGKSVIAFSFGFFLSYWHYSGVERGIVILFYL